MMSDIQLHEESSNHGGVQEQLLSGAEHESQHAQCHAAIAGENENENEFDGDIEQALVHDPAQQINGGRSSPLPPKRCVDRPVVRVSLIALGVILAGALAFGAYKLWYREPYLFNTPCRLSPHPIIPGQLTGQPKPWEETPEDLTIAYVADVALGPGLDPFPSSRTGMLYDVIKSEGAEAMVLSGDFDYKDCPRAFDDQISLHLGENFPVFSVLGNHDLFEYVQYSHVINNRLIRSNMSENCMGVAGSLSLCSFKGILIAQASPGIFPTFPWLFTYEEVSGKLEKLIGDYSSRWMVCSWHKNQNALQLGDKSSQAGWGVFELCQQKGAMIATGHEHSYSRTRLLDDVRHQTVSPLGNSSFIPLAPGRTLVFVNGLGGKDERPASRCETEGDCPYWAARYTAQEGAMPSALFCKYNYKGQKNRAYCYLKNINGEIRDEFTIDVSDMPQQPKPTGPA